MTEEQDNILVDIEDNPVPQGTVAGYLDMPHGIRLRFARFRASVSPAIGTVVLLQGRNETIEKYFETARDLGRKGLQTATFDWRGQGGSTRLLRDPLRAHVESFHAYEEDLDAFFEQVVLPDCRPPYYLVAHSTGALVALLSAPRLANRVRRIVLCAPFLGLHDETLSPGQIRALSAFLTTIGLHWVYLGPEPAKFLNRPFSGNKVTSDPARFARNQAIVSARPSLALGAPTAGWLAAASRALRRVWEPEFIASIHTPVLLVAAGLDEVVSSTAIEQYAAWLRSGAYISIDGARHELLQEADMFREQLLAAINAFIPGSDTAPF